MKRGWMVGLLLLAGCASYGGNYAMCRYVTDNATKFEPAMVTQLQADYCVPEVQPVYSALTTQERLQILQSGPIMRTDSYNHAVPIVPVGPGGYGRQQ